MVISERFKKACRRARDEDGYTHVVSTVGKYRATTYVECWSIEDLLVKANGTHLGVRVTPRQGMWTGHLNARQLWGAVRLDLLPGLDASIRGWG